MLAVYLRESEGSEGIQQGNALQDSFLNMNTKPGVVTHALGRLRLEDCKFKTSQGYVRRPIPVSKKKGKKEKQ
jgi:hypothetical protein